MDPMLSARITNLREAKGLTKSALSKLVGVSDVAVRYWETGETVQIGHEHLLALAKALGVSVSTLLDDPMCACKQSS